MNNGNLSKILVAIDGSDTSMKAADVAINTAKKHGAKLYVVTSMDPYPEHLHMSGFKQYYDYARKKEKEEAEQWFEQISKKSKENGIDVHAELVGASPSIVGAIINYAEKENVDLIIVGTRGRTGFKKILLGSVASGIVTYATCPVMVVK